MSAEEADKTTTTDASAGDEEEEWLYGGERRRMLIDRAVLDVERLECFLINYIEVEESTPMFS